MAIEVIKRRPGIRYRAIFRIKGNKAPSKTFSRKIDAEGWLAEMIAARRRGDYEKLPNREPISFEKLYERFRSEHALSRQAPSTQKLEHRIYCQYIAPYLNRSVVSCIRRKELESLFRELTSKGLSSKRVNRVRTFLHGIFNFAVREELVVLNPVSNIRPLPVTRNTLSSDVGYLTQEEARRLLDWLTEHDKWLYPKVLVLLKTGIRYGEMVALRVKDLSFAQRGAYLSISRSYDRHTYVVRNQTKGNKARVVPLGLEVAVVLQRRAKDVAIEQSLLWNDWEECRHPTKFYQHFRKALDSINVNRIRVHDLRHTFAVHFLENGGHLFDLQQILGHSTSKLTERYSHFSKVMMERVRNVVEGVQNCPTKLEIPAASHKRPTSMDFPILGDLGLVNPHIVN